jgi:hypothetical protein
VPDDCQLHVAKQRSGETKRLGLHSDLARCRFRDYGAGWEPYSERKPAEDKPAPRAKGFGFDGRKAAGGDR